MTIELVKRIVFTITGIVVLAAALIQANYDLKFIKKAIPAKGEVIRLNAGKAHVEIRFTTYTGKVMEYPQNGMIYCELGEKVTVLYDPENPDHVQMNTFGAIWGLLVPQVIMGLFFTWAGLTRNRNKIIQITY
ncbi:MAG: DUF3592 domain-containing protein [Daejeonella sp.]